MSGQGNVPTRPVALGGDGLAPLVQALPRSLERGFLPLELGDPFAEGLHALGTSCDRLVDGCHASHHPIALVDGGAPRALGQRQCLRVPGEFGLDRLQTLESRSLGVAGLGEGDLLGVLP